MKKVIKLIKIQSIKGTEKQIFKDSNSQPGCRNSSLGCRQILALQSFC